MNKYPEKRPVRFFNTTGPCFPWDHYMLHLLLMAFLQRVLNGGGKIDREYAAGRGRMDLLVEYNSVRHVIKIKLIHRKTIARFDKGKGPGTDRSIPRRSRP